MGPQIFFELGESVRRAQPRQIVGEFCPRQLDLALEGVEIGLAHRMLRPPPEVPAGLEAGPPPGLCCSMPKLWLEPLAGGPPELAPLRCSVLPDIASLNVSATSPATSFSPPEVSPRSCAALFKRSPALPAASIALSPASSARSLSFSYALPKARPSPSGGGDRAA